MIADKLYQNSEIDHRLKNSGWIQQSVDLITQYCGNSTLYLFYQCSVLHSCKAAPVEEKRWCL